MISKKQNGSTTSGSKKIDQPIILARVLPILAVHQVTGVDETYVNQVLTLVKERMTFVEDFWEQASFFFQRPTQFDADAVKPKWNADKTTFFQSLITDFNTVESWEAATLEPLFKEKNRNLRHEDRRIDDAIPYHVGRW